MLVRLLDVLIAGLVIGGSTPSLQWVSTSSMELYVY